MYFLLWLLCGQRRSSSAGQALALRPRLWIASAHPLTTTHLIVLILFPHEKFTPVYLRTFASCSDMHLLLWLLWYVATLELKEESWLRPSLLFAEALLSAAGLCAAEPTKAELDGFEQCQTFCRGLHIYSQD
jgi:hypothetical protein